MDLSSVIYSYTYYYHYYTSLRKEKKSILVANRRCRHFFYLGMQWPYSVRVGSALD